MNDEIYATHNNLPHNQTAYTDCCERAKFTVNRASRARKMAPPTWAPAANALCSNQPTNNYINVRSKADK